MKNFDWNRFKEEKIAVHCKTEREANDFCEKADKQNIKWGFLRKVFEKNNLWNNFKENTCYNYNRDLGFNYDGLSYCDIDYYKKRNYKIIEWSDYMNKEFTKEDLKDWMLVVTRNDDRWIVTKDATILSGEGNEFISFFNYINFKNRYNSKYDIVEVYSERKYGNPIVLTKDGRKLLYKEEEEVEEITLSEIEQMLGKKIKIISEE